MKWNSYMFFQQEEVSDFGGATMPIVMPSYCS